MVGGTSMYGGVGSVGGIFIGVLIMGIINNRFACCMSIHTGNMSLKE